MDQALLVQGLQILVDRPDIGRPNAPDTQDSSHAAGRQTRRRVGQDVKDGFMKAVEAAH